MIFKIADGRECFYQWDIDRQLIVSDPTITEVHFCNRTDVCSLVVEVVDGVANVPNKLLQSGFDVRVFGYDGKATMHEATFKVKARTQPADYVYTETVVKSIDEILEAAETVTTTANEFYEFVEDHTLDFTDDGEGNVELVAVDCEGGHTDLTDYYTKTEVNELIENIDIPETDLTGYATETYVNEAIANIDIPEVDLEPYAKKTDIPDVSNFISEIPSEYVTESELNAKGYATKAELNDKANTNHTHTGYAKTNHTHSTADVDGLQKVLNEKVTQADIDKAIELHDHRYDYAPIDHNHGDEYAAKSHVHSYNSLLDKPTIPSVEGLASEAYVNAAVKNVKPDLTGYATEKYVDDAIAGIEIPEGGSTEIEYFRFDLENLSTVGEEIEAALAAGKLPVYKMTDGAHLVYAGKQGNIYKFTSCAVNPNNFSDLALGYAFYDASTKKWTATNNAQPVQKKLFVNREGATETLTSLTIDGKNYAIPQGGSADLTGYATEDFVTQAIETALSGIAQAEGGAY
jgi:hypothetical protein